MHLVPRVLSRELKYYPPFLFAPVGNEATRVVEGGREQLQKEDGMSKTQSWHATSFPLHEFQGPHISMSGPLYCFYHARWVCTDVFPSVGKGRPSIVPPAHHRGPLPSQRCMHAPSPSCFVKGIKVLPSFPFHVTFLATPSSCHVTL